ncbi:Innexin unc 7 [Brachionus plicatilis]|uniref:Innexin n=1 Tax=Brachionus plicatilis TaxID=10195 RepID=A0A3M7P270_BRAPC|nr:Innexin unc 7 [Brachionus plicatilis]
MDQILEAYQSVKNNAIRGDFIDKIHSKYSIVVIFVSIAVILIRLGDGYGINCWLPTHLSDSQTDYTHQICWINNTYYYPKVKDADLYPQSPKYVIHYYQFILFILFGQALLFMLPDFAWKILSSNSRGYVKKLLDQLNKKNVLKESIKNAPKTTGLLRSMSRETEMAPLLVNDELRKTLTTNFHSLVHQENEKIKSHERKNSYYSKELSDSDSFSSNNLKLDTAALNIWPKFLFIWH